MQLFGFRNSTQASRGDYRKPKASSVIDTGLKQKKCQKQGSAAAAGTEDATSWVPVEEEKDHVIEDVEDRSRGVRTKPSLAEKLGFIPEFTRNQNK